MASGGMRREITARTNSHVSASVEPGPLFRSSVCERSTKVLVEKACCCSRLVHGSRGWDPLSKSLAGRLHGKRMKTLRTIWGVKILKGIGRGSEEVTDSQVLRDLKVLPVKVVVMLEGLRYAAQMSQRAPRMLLALLQESRDKKDGWSARLLRDLSVMQRMLPQRVGRLPFPAASPRTWEQLWTNHGPQWKQLVALLEAKLIERGSLGEPMLELCEFGVTSDEGVPSSLSQGSSLSRSQEQEEATIVLRGVWSGL